MTLARSFPEVLSAGRWMLRPVGPSNASVERELSDDAEVRRWTFYPQRMSAEALDRRVQRIRRNALMGRSQRYVITSGPDAIGTAGLAVTRRGGIDVFYALLPSGRGRGAATASVRALSDWAIGAGADRVEASVLSGNVASERVLRTVGFRSTGRDIDPRDGEQLRTWTLPAR